MTGSICWILRHCNHEYVSQLLCSFQRPQLTDCSVGSFGGGLHVEEVSKENQVKFLQVRISILAFKDNLAEVLSLDRLRNTRRLRPICFLHQSIHPALFNSRLCTFQAHGPRNLHLPRGDGLLLPPRHDHQGQYLPACPTILGPQFRRGPMSQRTRPDSRRFGAQRH